MKTLTFILTFIVSSAFQALISKLMHNYWFPNELAPWVLRLFITFLISIYAYNKMEK